MTPNDIEAYLSDELEEQARLRLEEKLQDDPQFKEGFLQQASIDAALSYLLAEKDEDWFDSAVIARLQSEGAEDDRRPDKSILAELVSERYSEPKPWPDLIKTVIITAAASILLMLGLQKVIVDEKSYDRSDKVIYGPDFVARVEQSRDAVWSEQSNLLIRKDGWLTRGKREIQSGSLFITFNSGASAIIEGPASFSIESPNRIFLEHGTLTADVPPPATGFTVNTRRMNVVDIGTRFEVNVDSSGLTELHVIKGKVEASRTNGNTTAALVTKGQALVADGRARRALSPTSYQKKRFANPSNFHSHPSPEIRYAFDGSTPSLIEDSGNKVHTDVALSEDGAVSEDGALSFSPKRATGAVGGGLLFTRKRELDVPLSRDFRIADSHTIAFWVRIPAQLEPIENCEILSYGNENRRWQIGSNLNLNQGVRGALRVAFDTGYLVGSTDIADGKWHHVAYRFIGGDQATTDTHVHLFVDGVLEPISDLQIGNITQGNASMLIFGDSKHSGFKGRIDEFHLYDEAISTTLIQSLANR